MMSFSSVAAAAPIQIGLFSFDTGTPTGDSFSISNFTGPGALPPDFPLETLLTFSVTSLVAELSGGGTLTVDGSAFTSDAAGNVTCAEAGDAGTGDCNFAAYELLSATIMGTLAPTSGLLGLPPGFVGIASAFSATLTPSGACGSFLTAGCEAVVIEATLVPDTGVPVPEPSTIILLQLGVGALAARRLRFGRAFLRR
jgi:hypothetical protein